MVGKMLRKALTNTRVPARISGGNKTSCSNFNQTTQGKSFIYCRYCWKHHYITHGRTVFESRIFKTQRISQQ